MAQKINGPTTTPKYVMPSVAPVACAMSPAGAMRATSATNTPFHPIALAPTTTASRNTAADAQSADTCDIVKAQAGRRKHQPQHRQVRDARRLRRREAAGIVILALRLHGECHQHA